MTRTLSAQNEIGALVSQLLYTYMRHEFDTYLFSNNHGFRFHFDYYLSIFIPFTQVYMCLYKAMLGFIYIEKFLLNAVIDKG